MAKLIKESKEKETKIDKKIKSALPFILFLGVLVIIFFISYYFFRGLNTIEYGGMTFTRTMFGSVLLYHTSYNAVSEDGKVAKYDLYLRVNPEENNVPAEGKIIYPAYRGVYSAVNESGLDCNLTLVALSELSQFIAGNFLKFRAGTSDYNESVSKNITYVSCEEYLANTVIMIKSANETRITNANTTNVTGKKNCYEIDVANCEIVPAVEKFIVRSLIDAKEE